MSREILQLAEALASEKNVDAEIVFGALEFALGIAAKKKAEREHMDVRVEIDRDTGSYQTFRRWLIVEDEAYTYPELEKTIEQIQEENSRHRHCRGRLLRRRAAQRKFRPPKPRKLPNKSSCSASAMPSATDSVHFPGKPL